MATRYCSKEVIEATYQRVRDGFHSGLTRPLEWRKRQLRGMVRMVEENRDRFCEAARQDLNKPPFETEAGCLSGIKTECAELLTHLKEWSSPEYPSVPFINKFDGAQIRKDPLGCVLVIGAWNYPFSLCLSPMAGAIAAGNSVILKPSELSAASAELMKELIPKYLDPEAIGCVTGAKDETQQLLDSKWDHIFYTGGTEVGRIIYQKAAAQLCPVTLELGGKSPCLVLDDANLPVTARRIAWGRWMNAGQTCVAPDYVLCSSRTAERLIPELEKAVKEFYGEDPSQSDSYGRIINERHVSRIKQLIDSEKVVLGGNVNEKNLYISPTVLNGVTPEDAVMQEEIFGPLLPIVHVEDPQKQGVEIVNGRAKPLALYIFTDDQKKADDILNRTSSGGACVNDTIMQLACPSLPFGGVGASGFGAYHGRFSFDTFVHKRGTLMKSSGFEFLNSVRYPPYSEKNLNLLKKMVPKERTGPNLGALFDGKVILGVGILGYLIYSFLF